MLPDIHCPLNLPRPDLEECILYMHFSCKMYYTRLKQGAVWMRTLLLSATRTERQRAEGQADWKS